MHGIHLRDDGAAVADRAGSVRRAALDVARGRERLRAVGRRALALLLGCALVVSWIGSARPVCGMTAAGVMAGHAAMHHAAGHARGAAQAAMAGHGPARDVGAGAAGDDGCPMRGQTGAPCSALLHCVAVVAAAPAVSGLPRGPDDGRAAPASAHGPLLGESETAAEPVAPPPRG